MMKRPQKNGVEPIAEHDQPTEPINVVISPYAPTVTSDDPTPATIPISPVRPFSQQPASPPLIGAYPFLPPIPKQRGSASPAGGIAPAQPGNASSGTKRRSLFPALAGLFFVVIQLLLLVRFALSVVHLWDGLDWVKVFYSLTSIFIWPVQTLLQMLPLPFVAGIEISTLVAILLYGLFSRILVRFLKLLLRSR